MRVAVLEPHPRTCGVTTWAFQLVHGFRGLGHHADVVSFTKSGRQLASRTKDGKPRIGWTWYAESPDVTERIDRAAAVLDTYDLIVLNEPKNGTVDNQAEKNSEVPYYVTALAQTRTPWVTALHDARAYDPKRAPFLGACVSSPSFTGVAIECRPGSYASGEWALAGRVTKLVAWPWLPYRPRHVDVPRFRSIGLTGRMTPHKGLAALAHVAPDLPDGWEVRYAGAESGGLGPCNTYNLYEALALDGWTGRRNGNPNNQERLKMETGRSVEINNWGSVNSAWDWWLQRGAVTMRYTGPFLDPLTVLGECAIAVQLSTDEVVTTFEYTTLEALDAGCLPVLPTYYRKDMGDVQYAAYWLEGYGGGATISKQQLTWEKNTGGRVELVAKLRAACEQVSSGCFDPGVNRQALATYHDPRLLAARILEVL